MFGVPREFTSEEMETILVILNVAGTTVSSSYNLYYFKMKPDNKTEDGITLRVELRYGAPGGGLESGPTFLPLEPFFNQDRVTITKILLEALAEKLEKK